MTGDRLERAVTVLLTVAAIALAVVAVRREFFPSPPTASTTDLAPPTFEARWRNVLPIGIRTGESTAPVTLVVFNDLECPACAAFHGVVKRVVREHGADVSVVFVHFPLDSHRFAVQAAQAAECANAQGRFERFVDAVYTGQDSLGMRSWGSYAQEAGIADTAAISRCARDPVPSQRIEAGRELALEWRLRGTPTVMINGRRYESPPTKDEIDRMIGELLKDSPGASDRSAAGLQATSGSLGSQRSTFVPRATLRDSNLVARTVLRLLFDGISLSVEQRERATLVVKRTWREHFRLDPGTPAEQVRQAAALNAVRDSVLMDLLTTESDRSRFEQNAESLRSRNDSPSRDSSVATLGRPPD